MDLGDASCSVTGKRGKGREGRGRERLDENWRENSQYVLAGRLKQELGIRTASVKSSNFALAQVRWLVRRIRNFAGNNYAGQDSTTTTSRFFDVAVGFRECFKIQGRKKEDRQQQQQQEDRGYIGEGLLWFVICDKSQITKD